MRRSLFIMLLASLLALALVAPAAFAKSEGKEDGKSDGRKGGPGHDLTLYAIEDAFVFVTREGDVFEDEEAEEEFAPDMGDRFIVTETVYNDEERTDEAGQNHIECVVTEAVGEFPETEPEEGDELPFFEVSFVCSGVLELHDQGTLSWSGVTGFSSEDGFEEMSDEPFIELAITGGTDDFIGASGQATIFEEAGESEEEVLSRYEIELLKRRGR